MEKEIEILVEAAEQLQALKATLIEQQGTSVRLRGLTEILEKVAEQIAKIPVGLSSVVVKAEAVEQRVIAAAEKIEVLRDGIPEIIERIERSEIGQSVDYFTKGTTEISSDLKNLQNNIFRANGLIENFRIENSTTLNDLKEDSSNIIKSQEKAIHSIDTLRSELLTKLDDIEKKIESTEKWATNSIVVTKKAFENIANALKYTGEIQSKKFQEIHNEIETMRGQEISEIRKELTSISELIRQQGSAIEVLSKKKGFHF